MMSSNAHKIAPAHAGTSLPVYSATKCQEDHPRTRGDKGLQYTAPPISQGSPPHTRGQESTLLRVTARGRITPAHAGTRKITAFTTSNWEDHPRTRGDKIVQGNDGHDLLGSPPHTRGQARPLPGRRAQHRITPAHAGTSFRLHGWPLG